MTYTSLAAVFVAAAALVAVAAARLARLPRRWWWATVTVALILVVLTAAFDTVMIETDLFRYDTSSLTGLRVFVVPIEDFAWPIAAVLVLPALWELVGLPRFDQGAGREH